MLLQNAVESIHTLTAIACVQLKFLQFCSLGFPYNLRHRIIQVSFVDEKKKNSVPTDLSSTFPEDEKGLHIYGTSQKKCLHKIQTTLGTGKTTFNQKRMLVIIHTDLVFSSHIYKKCKFVLSLSLSLCTTSHQSSRHDFPEVPA